jgi:hypothetical protein
VAGIPGKARENIGKCPLENKWQCPTTKQNALQPLYYKGFARHFSMKRTIYLNHQVFELFRYAYWGKDVNRFAK